MFPIGQPPYPPSGAFPGFQQAAPQAMRSFAPMANQAMQAGARGFGVPGFSPYGFAGPGFSLPGFAGGANAGTQALGAAGTAAKTGGVGWLGHMQTALKAMQSAAPMVQQYGPMMKNIPAMINMVKLMNMPDDEEGSESATSKESSYEWESSSTSKESSSSSSINQGTSQPKLYI